ncbi:MAG: hypothetical protein GC190_16955 [Alphaproteobacteria bacterium]|nr:hypothetical protein [Alphaproteobacteria bacterium]
MLSALAAVSIILVGSQAATAEPEAPENRPPVKVEFPSTRDWHSLHITMSRTACFGMCPIYHVDIAGDGTVRFEGVRFTAVTGPQQATIARDAVEALFNKFRAANFFWLYREYTAQVTDLPSCILKISFDGKEMTVQDYGGDMVGMPAVVRELERAVDLTAQTDRWVRGPK